MKVNGLSSEEDWMDFTEDNLLPVLISMVITTNSPLLILYSIKLDGIYEFLPVSIKEQLSATNMEFSEKGKYLYVVGGYGYSATTGDHTTYPYITAIDVGRSHRSHYSKFTFSKLFQTDSR
ncbi:MAG: hypothetical protein IPG79_18550 [Saprospiraceae bacterium]|nr:hypothetical protein [Saprospiraceae bacterium]